jgi:hypothetical protein
MVGPGDGVTLGEDRMLGVTLGSVGLAVAAAVGLADGLAVAIATSGVDVAPAPVELGCVEPVRLTATKYTTTKAMDTPARTRRFARTWATLPRTQ